MQDHKSPNESYDIIVIGGGHAGCEGAICFWYQIFFDSDNLIIKEEGNMIFATKGFAKIPSKNIEIEGDKFIYNKFR